MNSRMSRYRRVIGGSAAAVVLMGGGTAIGVALTGGASAATGSPSANGTSIRHPCAHQGTRRSARGAAARLPAAQCLRLHRLALAGGIHGQVTFKARSGFRTIAFERGKIESVSTGAFMVRAADGTTWTWHLVKGSVVRESGSEVAASKVAAGEQVLVAGPVVSGSDNVKLVRIRPAA